MAEKDRQGHTVLDIGLSFCPLHDSSRDGQGKMFLRKAWIRSIISFHKDIVRSFLTFYLNLVFYFLGNTRKTVMTFLQFLENLHCKMVQHIYRNIHTYLLPLPSAFFPQEKLIYLCHLWQLYVLPYTLVASSLRQSMLQQSRENEKNISKEKGVVYSKHLRLWKSILFCIVVKLLNESQSLIVTLKIINGKFINEYGHCIFKYNIIQINQNLQ